MGRHFDSSPSQRRSVRQRRDILAARARPPHHPNELYRGARQGPRQPRPSNLLRSPCLAGADARYAMANAKRPASCSATERQRARAGRSDQPRAGIRHYWQRAPASLSTTTVTFGWNCRMEAGTSGVTGPKKARRTISALSEPLATTRISLAAMMVPMPMV